MKDFFAFFDSFAGVPFIGYNCQTKVLSKASSNIVFFNMIAIKIDAGQMRFSILEAGNYKIVIIRILIVALLVAKMGEIV